MSTSTIANPQSEDDSDWEGSNEYEEVWFSPIKDKEPLVGYVTHHNKETFGSPDNETITIKTNIGNIVVSLVRTTNSKCKIACPDSIEVTTIPNGYVAIPSMIQTHEDSIENIEIFKYTGM